MAGWLYSKPINQSNQTINEMYWLMVGNSFSYLISVFVSLSSSVTLLLCPPFCLFFYQSALFLFSHSLRAFKVYMYVVHEYVCVYCHCFSVYPLMGKKNWHCHSQSRGHNGDESREEKIRVIYRSLADTKVKHRCIWLAQTVMWQLVRSYGREWRTSRPLTVSGSLWVKHHSCIAACVSVTE